MSVRNYRDVSSDSRGLLYIVVSNVSVRFRDTIVMNPPIAGCYIVVSNVSATFHESIVLNPPIVGALCRCILRQSSDGQFQCSALLSSSTCRSSGSSSVLGMGDAFSISLVGSSRYHLHGSLSNPSTTDSPRPPRSTACT